MREKFGPLRGKKKDKKQDINRDIIFQKNGRLDPFFPQKELKTFWNSWKVEPVDEELEVATTCYTNEQQQDAKNNAAL